MTGRITLCGGETRTLPPLLSWQLRRTGGVPCDSFRVTCPWDTDTMAALPAQALRFAAVENGKEVWRGVVDECCASLSGEGAVLEIGGRGMAALLLDNEAEPASYQCATAEEILRRHAGPYGIAWDAPAGARTEGFTVSGGTSEWRVIEELARACGLTPYFRADGHLTLRTAAASGAAVVLPEEVLSAERSEKRYGVVSEAVVLERGTGRRYTVKNGELCALGGQCRRVIPVPAQSDALTLRRAGEYQLAQSRREWRTLRAVFAGHVAVDAGQRALLRQAWLGGEEEYTVTETVWCGGADGETTQVRLRKE